jgi:hypothetical protein
MIPDTYPDLSGVCNQVCPYVLDNDADNEYFFLTNPIQGKLDSPARKLLIDSSTRLSLKFPVA